MTAIVALSDVDHCNMALSHLSISQTIQSISPPDQSPAAQACAFWYPKMRNWLLRMAPWNFADVNMALASDTTTAPGWNYAYQYPNDCLQLLAVTTQYGQRFGAQFWSNFWSNFAGSPLTGAIPKIPTKVVQSTMSPGNLAILCDLPSTSPVYAFYIQCVTNTALFDALFSDCLSLYIASRIGGPLRANIQKVAAIAEAAQMMRLQALAQAMNESQQDPERVSPSISVRW
jgi:hypothetical protein